MYYGIKIYNYQLTIIMLQKFKYITTTMKKKIAIILATQFLSYKGHLQLTVFICCEYLQKSYMSCIIAIHHIYDATQLQLCQNN